MGEVPVPLIRIISWIPLPLANENMDITSRLVGFWVY